MAGVLLCDISVHGFGYHSNDYHEYNDHITIVSSSSSIIITIIIIHFSSHYSMNHAADVLSSYGCLA
jgi:hypothetical protein